MTSFFFPRSSRKALEQEGTGESLLAQIEVLLYTLGRFSVSSSTPFISPGRARHVSQFMTRQAFAARSVSYHLPAALAASRSGPDSHGIHVGSLR